MSATRIILAGILGGIAMFIWSSIAHMALPLGKTGIKELPNQQAIFAALQAGLGDKGGLYLFPGLGVGDNPTKEQASEAMKHINERMAANPSGVLVYHPTGTQPFSFGKFLGIEFGTECLEALLAVQPVSGSRHWRPCSWRSARTHSWSAGRSGGSGSTP